MSVGHNIVFIGVSCDLLSLSVLLPSINQFSGILVPIVDGQHTVPAVDEAGFYQRRNELLGIAGPLACARHKSIVGLEFSTWAVVDTPPPQ